MNEWDQTRAERRSLETMRRIAQDALEFLDDDSAFDRYAAEHMLTVNEIVYYLNAFEYGGDEGLQAIRLPDIIPAGVAGRAIKTISKMLDSHFEGRLPYRLTDEGTAVGLYEIQQRYQTGEHYLFPVAQFRLTVTSNHWHLYWMRKFDAWWPYEPPARGHKYSLKARAQQIMADEYGCFWG
jgi:hypothetical protein